MRLRIRIRGRWELSRLTLPAIPLALAALVIPAPADAKVSCEQRGVQGLGAEVTGLPAEPVAGRTYPLTVTVDTANAIHAVPKLAIIDCAIRGAAVHRRQRWLRATPTGETGSFAVDVRFPKAGTWAMSLFDLSGQFQDLGLHRVRDDNGVGSHGGERAENSADARPSIASRAALVPWVGGGALLLAVAGATFAARRRASGRGL